MSGFFVVTDGTTRIDLASNNNGGVHIVEWIPLAPPPENLWNASPFTDGRQLAYKKYGNTADYLKLHIAGGTMDNTIRLAQDLRRLLTKAVEYWTSEWTTGPVWLEVLGDMESETRYAYVYDFDMPHDSDPFQPPFGDCPSVMEEVELTIEHGFWMNTLSGECVQISGKQDYYQVYDGEFTPNVQADNAWVDETLLSIDTVSPMEMGASGIGADRNAGVRFDTVTIPQGAIIISAYIDLVAVNDLSDTTCNIKIYGEDIDDSLSFSTYADFMARTRTTANVAWNDLPAWTAGNTYTSPNIASVIQEIVNRAGFVSGNGLTVFLEDNGSSASAKRDFQGAPDADEAVLRVSYYDPDTPVSFGRNATCANEVFVANKHNQAQLTHVFYYDDSGAAYSANLLNAALPYDLLPAIPASDDLIYFVIDTSVTNSGPFCSLVFDLSVGATNIADYDWEYWDGAAWSVLTVVGSGGGLDTAGIAAITWDQPDDWDTTTINGVTGYMVRYHVTAVNPNPTPPTQQNRDVYAVLWPYVEIDEAQIGGDYNAIAAVDITPIGNGPQKLYLGLRSVSRGDDFTAFLNCSDEQNPTGVTVTAVDASVSIADDPTAPTGRSAVWDTSGVAADTWTSLLTFALNAAIGQQYMGTYRLFVRHFQDGGANNEISLRVRLTVASQVVFTGQTVPIVSNNWDMADLGIIRIPTNTNGWNSVGINIQGITSNTAPLLYLYDIILLPTDEWACEYDDDLTGGLTPGTDYVSIDPLENPKQHNPALTKIITTDEPVIYWSPRGINAPMLQANSTQRLWFAFGDMLYSTGGQWSFIAKLQMYHAAKYYTMRGAR